MTHRDPADRRPATRRLGDTEVSALGLGCMPLSRRGRDGLLPDRARAVRTVHEALDRGITLLDTADCYGPDDDGFGHNEELVAEALTAWGGHRDDLLVATKCGIRRDGAQWPVDGRPEWIREAVHGSLRRLSVERIGLHQHHRPDPAVPYAETIGAFRELYDEGLVARVGLSNASCAQILEAHELLGDALVSVQNEYSPRFRGSQPELDLCTELGLAFLPWSPLGGMQHAADLGSEQTGFAAVARERGVSPQQVCLAWLLTRSPAVIPIPGASRPASVADCADAVHLRLTPEELARLP